MDWNGRDIFDIISNDIWTPLDAGLFKDGLISFGNRIKQGIRQKKNKMTKHNNHHNKKPHQHPQPKSEVKKEEKPTSILIFDMESTLTKSIVKKVEYLGLKAQLVKWDSSDKENIDFKKIKSIIISGCSKVVEPNKATILANDGPIISRKYLEIGIPVLGICYGHQLLGYKHGSTIGACDEDGFVPFRRFADSKLFAGLDQNFLVYMKHNWMLNEPPQNEWNISWKITGGTQKCPIAAMEYEHLYGIQFHPEHWQSLTGTIVLSNFLGKICSLPVERY